MQPTLLLANYLVGILSTLFCLTCLFMMLVILIQKPKGGGLSGAFGGAGGSAQAAFGAKTGDLLTTITIGCFVAFLGLAIGLVYAIRDDVSPKIPVATPAVSPANTGTTGGTTTGGNPGTTGGATTTDPAEAAADAEQTLGEVGSAADDATPDDTSDAQP